jgi:hypothetical protein
VARSRQRDKFGLRRAVEDPFARGVGELAVFRGGIDAPLDEALAGAFDLSL